MKWTVLTLPVILLAGCVGYHPKPIDLSQQASRLEHRRLTGTALARDAARLGISRWPPQRWTRADLLLVALSDSPDIAVARTQLLVTRAGQITAREYPNPQLTLGAEYALAAGSAGIAPWLYQVLVQVLLPQTDLRNAERLRSQFYTQAAGWHLVARVWRVRSQLRKALLNARYAGAAGVILSRQADDARHLARLLEDRLQAGEAAAPQVRSAEALALAAAQRRDAMRARFVAARHRLAAVIGVPVAALPPLASIWRNWRTVRPVSDAQLRPLKTQALLSRADLARAVADYQAAEQALRIEVDRQYPGIHVGPGYTFDHGVRKLPARVSFALPILNQNQGPIAQAAARRARAGARMEAVQARILAAVSTARERGASARAIARRFRRRLLPLAARQLEATQQRFELGQSGRSTVLDARIAFERTQFAALRADFTTQAARGALEDALQHPFDPAELALTASSTSLITMDASP